MMRFEVGDLLRMRVPRGRYDLVLCRNTVIYFTEDVRDALHERLVDVARARAATSSSARPSASPTRARIGLDPPLPFVYRKTG